MEQLFRRFCVLLLTMCFIFIYPLSVLAKETGDSNDTEYVQRTSWWHWAFANPNKSSILYGLFGYTLGKVCPVSEDGYHRASTAIVVSDVFGTEHYSCNCDYCGHNFFVYDEDLKQSYEAQVSELPAPGYCSDGSLLYSLVHDRISFYYYAGYGSRYYYCEHGSGSNVFSSDYFSFTVDCASNSVRITPSSGDSRFKGVSVTFIYKGTAPIDGYYTLLSAPGVTGHYIDAEGVDHSVDKNYTPSSSSVYRTAGSEFGCSISPPTFSDATVSAKFASFQSFVPVYKVTQVDSSLGDSYSPNTRPSAINEMNYGLMGDDGKISIVNDNSTIVNETNNTYYNPATGQTSPITNWSYDYTDRSYTITKEDGSTSTVTYGDENITIKEGDTVYNIYYMTDGSTENPPQACDHTWVESSRTEPTCTVPGSIKSTCSKCGETKTEPIPVIDHTWTASDRTEPTCTVPGSQKSICSQCSQTKTEPIPALGHAWTAVRTVPTQYDENGTLTQEGYTLYECSRCKEQYKSTDGTGPPGGTGSEDENGDSIWDKLGNFLGSIFGGVSDLLGAALGKLLDALTALAAMLLEKLAAVVETVLSILDEAPKLFSGFLDFLALLFPYLPPEITLLLTFGVVAVVFAAIIKAIRS